MYKSIADSLRKLLDYNRTTIGHCNNFRWAVLQQHQEHLYAQTALKLQWQDSFSKIVSGHKPDTKWCDCKLYTNVQNFRVSKIIKKKCFERN